MKTNKLIWLPRVIGIIYIMFLLFFTLDAFSGDVFSGNALLLEETMVLIIHLVPSLIILIVLAVSWKLPVIGGILFIALSVVFMYYFGTYEVLSDFFIISFPLAVIGLLFIVLQFAGTEKKAKKKTV